MKYKSLVALSALLIGVMIGVTGVAQLISPPDADDVDPVVRLAVADAKTQACSNDGSVDYSNNGLPGAGTPEARRAGLACQRTDMLSGGGDPFVTDADGAVVNASADAQAYASAALASAAPSASLERRFARALAAVLAVRDGFAIVPGGPSEAFNRIQTCLNGDLETNEGDLIVGTSLDCGEETIRRAVAEQIAPGFYVQFGELVEFGCDKIEQQALFGSTVESRWAASLAFVSGCPIDSDKATGIAAGGSESAELSFAIVAPLAQSGGVDVGNVGNLDLVNAYATSLAIANGVSLDATGNPVAGGLGNLFAFSLANFGNVAAFQAHGPLARAIFGPGELRISIVQDVSGAELPLIGTVLLRN